VSDVDCEALEAPFSEEEVVKEDLVEMFSDFHKGSLDLFRLNFAMLTLIPKIENATDMKNFRPIILLNCSFKIFSRLVTSRMERICQGIIAKEQSAFITDRYILKSVVVAHELVHSIHKSKAARVLIKLDYKKAYDMINLDFLVEILKSRGFGDKWIGWIKDIVFGGLSVC
jgi:hypothetical protein